MKLLSGLTKMLSQTAKATLIRTNPCFSCFNPVPALPGSQYRPLITLATLHMNHISQTRRTCTYLDLTIILVTGPAHSCCKV